jgi:hypothetical protein
MQYHYVVVYDSLSEKWEVDSETAWTVFNNGYFFNTDTQDWDVPNDYLEAYQEDYSDKSDELFKILEQVEETNETI